ncbi:hypothetical protein EVAR_71703_1 [Eumeta japonica]|uniref:Uncharacterized protein n=1 Tax=Eumeta variegata TaxID=151549 RepID=A0A4C1SYJ9_EUMVA|nr:hypothetical protein EVAR_71703_1 [Eumeta japonica]
MVIATCSLLRESKADGIVDVIAGERSKEKKRSLQNTQLDRAAFRSFATYRDIEKTSLNTSNGSWGERSDAVSRRVVYLDNGVACDRDGHGVGWMGLRFLGLPCCRGETSLRDGRLTFHL